MPHVKFHPLTGKCCRGAYMYVPSIDRPPAPSPVSLQGGEAASKNAKDVVRELYAGVDLPKLVQRMLVVMHEVRKMGMNVPVYICIFFFACKPLMNE